MAVKTKDFNVEGYDFSEDRNIEITKKHTALRIDNMTLAQAQEANYKIQGNKLIITYGGHSLTVLNYQGIKYIKTDFQQISKNKSTFNLYDLILYNKIDNTDLITTFDAKKFAATGATKYNDTIDMTESGYVVPTTGKNKGRGLTINGGDGSDTITGTSGNDTITGGTGENTVKILNETFGNDTIKLTKGEKLTLDMSEYTTLTSADSLKGKVKVSGKDLLITTNNGTINLKNFAKSNVVNDGYIKVKLNNGQFIDLNSDEVLLHTSPDSKNDNKKTATFTGSRFGETIADSTDLDNYTKKINTGNGKNTVYVTSKGKATVNGGSEADDITITGNGNHVIKTGNGENSVIITGKGTANITGGADKDTIKVYNNNSDTTINAGNGNNIVQIFGSTAKNTVTTGKDADEITLATIKDGITSTVNAGDGGNTIGFEGKGNNTIISGKHNDTINVWTGTTNTTIKAGAGENTINISNTSTFGDITLIEEKVSAKNIINFLQTIDENYTLIKSGNDLIIQNNENDSKIKIAGYYLTKTSKTKYAEIEFKINGDKKTVDEILSLTGKNITVSGNGTITGTENADNILANDYDENIKASNDTITGGKGNDIINAGRGTNKIKFSKGDGADIIHSGGGSDTLVFDKGVNVKAEYYDNNLVISYGTQGDTITLKDYTPDHSVKNIQIGNTKKSLSTYLPQPEEPETLNVFGADLTIGTDEADILNVTSGGRNRIFAGDGNDSITTGSGTNFIYGGKGNDIITVGSGTDYIYGGSGSNKIYISTGSGRDYTLDENDNTFIFTEISDLNNLKFTMGSQGAYSYIADLTISGYGNDTDTLTINNFFNTEGYDYSKIKLQAGVNGEAVSLYDLINKSDLNTSYFTGTWKARHNSATSSPAQYASQIDNIIFGNTPEPTSHNVVDATAGGNNTIYSGGTNEGLMGYANGGFTMIYGGDGDETFHAEGNKIYYNGQTYENRKYLIVVTKNDGTKEVKNGVFYNTAIADEQPYTKWVSSSGEKYDVYYTENNAIINSAKENGYIIERGFLSDGTSNINYVEYIKSSTGTVEGGGGNDTFYTGFGANGGDGNDTIYGSGVIYGNRGDDKFYIKDDYKDSLDPMYYVYTNSGNDYIDTTGISSNDKSSVSVSFGEGVNTLIIDGSRKVNIGIDTTSTFREEEPVSKLIETRYSFQARNTHYTAFVQNGDLYIAANNSNKSDNDKAVSYDGKGAGTLIIKGWGNLTDEQKDNITITYRELLATENYTASTFTINEFLEIIDGTSESFIEGGNGQHRYINEYGNEKINETYTFKVINNSDGLIQTTEEGINYINKDGITQTATRNTYDGYGDLTGTEERSVDYFIIGGNDAQTIRGGDGNDVIYGDNINGHDNNGDYISSTENDGADTIWGGKGNDYIIGGSGKDTIHGGSGTDYIDGGEGDDLLIGGTLGDTDEFNKSLLTSVFNLKEIHGGNGNDKIYSLGTYTDGTFDEANSKTYLGGNTYFTNNIYAGDGDDGIHANAYRDIVYAGKGNDTIYSYAYAIDSFYNSNATSEIYGEEGNDHIILKSHADVRAFGGDGNDTIDARESSVVYYNMLYGNKGNDTIYGSNSWDIIYTGQGDNYVEAGGGDDEIYGSDLWLGQGGDNIIKAGAGNDYIRTSGSSKVYGENGNDTIFIAMGDDNAPSNLYIDGGAGDDTYITDGGIGFDTIVASAGNDVIEFKGFVKDNTSYQYNGNDLVLSYTNDGYSAGLVLKDYKLGGFKNFTIKTYGGYDEGYSQNGQYSMTDFIKYLDNQYSMATTATDGDDIISATGNIDALGGNDFILAHSSTSTYDNPQVIDTGSGNNSVLAQAVYTSINGGTGDDEYGLQGSVATIVDQGGNNTVTVARQNEDNTYFDITLYGDGNNTITSANNANTAAYKITATGSGKQTIDVNSAEFRNHPVTNEQLFTTIKTGTGDDEIKLYLGSVEAGAGDDTITVKDGAASGHYHTYGATLKGEGGNDNYIIEGGYDWQSENGISVDLKALIDDSQGSNTVMFTSEFMIHDNLNLLLNVKADGTLGNFKHTVYNEQTQENIITETDYCGFIAGGMDLEYAGTVSTASCNGWDICDGVRFANTGTVSAVSRIEAYDGYYISSEKLSTIMEQAATWLTSDGREYASVWDAIKPAGQNDFNQENYNALYAIFNNENTWSQGT